MTVNQLHVVDSSGHLAECAVRTQSAGQESWTLEFDQETLGQAKFTNTDVFECLIQLRRWLAPKRRLILCNGARIDAWASSMARQMGGAHKVYLTRMGQPGDIGDLVDTLAAAPLDKISSVEEQAAYHAMWLRSLGIPAES